MNNSQLNEAYKLVYDLFKHLTTLNTGAILVVLALLEKFIKQPEWRFFVGFSVVLFLLSSIGCLAFMYWIAFLMANDEHPENLNRFSGFAVLSAVGGFLGGLCCLSAFLLGNFY